MGRRLGYCRISSCDQNPERQIDALKDQNVIFIYKDICTGSKINRPDLDMMLTVLLPGDKVIIMSLDRLSRSLTDLRNIVTRITKAGATLISIKENLTFTGEDSPMSVFLLSLMGAFAEFERAFIRERQAQGIAIAKERGAFKGGVRRLNKEQRDYLYSSFDSGVSKSKIARQLGVARTTVYSYLEFRKKITSPQ